jgi:N-acetylmuramoyl-L-alanine amidase
MPAILLEIGFLTNAAERRRLVDARYQERVAQGIVDGIKGYMSRTGTAALRRVGATPPR